MAPHAEPTNSSSHQADKSFSTQLHGEKVIASSEGFVDKLRSKDSSLHAEAVDSYSQFWDNQKAGADLNNEDSRLKLYTNLTNTYYNLATDFYEYGWGQSFHFARKSIGEDFGRSIARHEHFLANLAGLRPGMKVLDVGCGVGGPAREMIRLSGCHVTGLNNNDYQIERAREYAVRYQQEDHCEFVKGDFMKMPFPDNSFDAVYAIEATCHAPKLEGVYSEIFRVLKPGGTFALYEWVTTDQYDESDARQRQIILDVEKGDGIPKLFPARTCIQALQNVRFDIFFHEDLANTRVGNEVPWFVELEGGSMFSSLRGFARSSIGHTVTNTFISILETLGISPKGSLEVQKVLLTASDGLVAGGKMGIFTPMYTVGCRKPLE
ncbi:Delta(24)-sterol C-methyltransferase [Dimargaris cristalligena]|uniref:Sterol 24-C-methyltransferase n=1 Tax=Dimargaris cristalligena TaxID=215637 RepID=A0A4P9ZW29_9FUNG|nr:Delta(24)-sterol C-methyltransferase [Dimargaris cristalligena]RKP36870.1 S-adenosyl-L-methionine-dependent methyltransferase [Dimargaris cristalligena]|eukprot:RKP36870.1 S-adenosyl-L-methionine-dependent methyltransferase [Dimargaris cristalligena]